MKALIKFAVYLAVALAWATTDWLARNAQNALFTLGLISIVIGCFIERASLGFIVPGVVVCGLLIFGRLRSTSGDGRTEEGDA